MEITVASGTLLKFGKIVELLPSVGSQDIRKVRVESEGHESIQAVANLRRLESGGYSDQISFTDGGEAHSDSIDQETSAASVSEDTTRRNSKRKAAVEVQFLLEKFEISRNCMKIVGWSLIITFGSLDIAC